MRPEAVFVLAAFAVAAPGGVQAQAPISQLPVSQLPVLPAGPAPDAWSAQPLVDLVGLDKISGRATALSAPVGRELQFGTLTVVARACLLRPADVASDAAVFLDINDSRPGTKPFRAWMLLSEPSFSIFEHPVYDIRLVGCRAG